MAAMNDECGASVQFTNTVCLTNHKQRRSEIKKCKRKLRRQEAGRKRQEEIASFRKSEEYIDEERKLQEAATIRADLDERKRKVEHNLWLKRELAIRLKAERQRFESTVANSRELSEKEDMVLDDMAWSANAETPCDGRRKKLAWRSPFVTECTADSGDAHRSVCPLYQKTGACRFGRNCTKLHPAVGLSRVLLLSNMYCHPSLVYDSLYENEDDAAWSMDVWLEYDEADLMEHYRQFKEDVQTEVEAQYGPVRNLIVCRNVASHLRGNVYIVFERKEDAFRAYVGLTGRYYDSRRLYPEFRKIPSWRAAICGDYLHQKCSRGDRHCPFLHVFEI